MWGSVRFVREYRYELGLKEEQLQARVGMVRTRAYGLQLKVPVELKALVRLLFSRRASAWLLGVGVGDVGVSAS